MVVSFGAASPDLSGISRAMAAYFCAGLAARQAASASGAQRENCRWRFCVWSM